MFKKRPNAAALDNAIGRAFLDPNQYLYPFEFVSVFLLASLIGAAYLRAVAGDLPLVLAMILAEQQVAGARRETESAVDTLVHQRLELAEPGEI